MLVYTILIPDPAHVYILFILCKYVVLQALKLAFPSNTFLKNGIIQGVKVIIGYTRGMSWPVHLGYFIVPFCSVIWSSL